MYVIPVNFATPAFDEIVRLRYQVLLEPLGIELDEKSIIEEYKDTHLACYNEKAQLMASLSLSETTNDDLNILHVSVKNKIQSKGVGSF